MKVNMIKSIEKVPKSLAKKIENMNKIRKQRDELLKALKDIMAGFSGMRREIIASVPYRSSRLSEEKIKEYMILISKIDGD